MKTVTVDLNRLGPEGTVNVTLRRFSQTPSVGEQYLAVTEKTGLSEELNS